jgi:hypothetical protein
MARKTYKVNADMWTKLRDILVGAPEEFNPDSANLRGRNVKVGDLSRLGWLPDEWRAVWREDKDTTVYAIWSYDTPLAWRVYRNGKARWIMPDVRYSVTTSKHQGKVRTALSQIPGGI